MGFTDWAGAADDGNTDRGAGAEEGEVVFVRRHGVGVWRGLAATSAAAAAAAAATAAAAVLGFGDFLI